MHILNCRIYCHIPRKPINLILFFVCDASTFFNIYDKRLKNLDTKIQSSAGMTLEKQNKLIKFAIVCVYFKKS